MSALTSQSTREEALPPDVIADPAALHLGALGPVGPLVDGVRSIVVLREVEGYAYSEIAEALELPLTSVKVYLHRARLRLRETLRRRLPADSLPTTSGAAPLGAALPA